MSGAKALDTINRIAAHLQTRLIRRSFASFGNKSVIYGPLRLAAPEFISIGHSVYVGSGCWIQGRASLGTNSSQEVTLKIGNRVSISGFSTISAENSVIIEDNVLIARGVYICDHTHQVKGYAPIRDQGITQVNPIVIQQGAWIGQNSVVMPGVTIGAGAVIGANSIVMEDVPARTIFAGSPARLIKKIDER